MKADIDISHLRELLRIGEDGKLYWLARRPEQFKARFPVRACDIWNTKNAGKEAFTTPDDKGYMRGSIYGRKYLAHRVIWALSYGEWPASLIDHKDGNPRNNSLGNLRLADKSDNAQNAVKPSHNTSGFLGVIYEKRRRKWRADIKVRGRAVYIGQFPTAEQAAAAYAEAKARLHTFQPIERRA